MKKAIYILLLLLIFPVTVHGESLESEEKIEYFFPIFKTPTSPSRMETFTMTTPWDNASRTIRVYLPGGYDHSDQRYPVLYFSDGNVYVGRVEANFIWVGIDSEWWARWNELSPWVNNQMDLWWGMPSPSYGGLGNNYLAFLVNVKNVVDSNYRTKPEREFTAIGGASLGGMFSIYAGLERSDIFSKAIAFSPAVWFGSRDINAWQTQNNFFDHITAKQNANVDVWIYYGGNESHSHECFISICPTVGHFPTKYIEGAQRTHQILGGHLEHNPQGTHFVSEFLKYFGVAFNWLGW